MKGRGGGGERISFCAKRAVENRNKKVSPFVSRPDGIAL